MHTKHTHGDVIPGRVIVKDDLCVVGFEATLVGDVGSRVDLVVIVLADDAQLGFGRQWRRS